MAFSDTFYPQIAYVKTQYFLHSSQEEHIIPATLLDQEDQCGIPAIHEYETSEPFLKPRRIADRYKQEKEVIPKPKGEEYMNL